ncbi:NADPH-dependent FMN reductase [Aerococcus mictus]|uniref:NADPH-dependent FMN reductase n=1 Tax=Aerococcus mictus TaxID=2976810 RepID=UPI0018A6EAC9|nr:NAD(P)H-dependent oxidoreductase [Aerococcus mictus]
MTKYGVVLGSIRKNSFSEAIAKGIVKGLPEDAEVTFIETADLPLYSQDYDEAPEQPKEYTRFREEVKAQDAIIFVTPEHNRSVPASLKNAIDLGSRPYGSSVWEGKPALVASQSPAGIGGAIANHTLRQSLVFLDRPVMQQPELYIGNSANFIGENGEITAEDTQEFLANAGKAFAEFAAKFV